MIAEQLARLAGDFCCYLEGETLERNELWRSLGAIVEAADALPHMEPSPEEHPDPVDLTDSCAAVMARVGDAFGHDVFYEVGGAGVEASIGDLRDDLGDIYIDLRRGLEILESNAIDAVWELKFSFESHWGAHARSAMNVLG